MGKNKEKVFGARIEESIQEAVKKMCEKKGFSVQGFIKNALLRELEYQRTGKK